MSTSKNILRRVGVVFVIQRTNVKYAFLNPFSSLEALSPVGRKKIQRRCPCGGGGGKGGCTPDFKRQILRGFVPTSFLHCIYNALIQSQFDYSDIVWGNCGKTLFDRLQKLQNRAARVLTFSRYDTDTNRLFRQLNWKDLSTQFQDRYPLKC